MRSRFAVPVARTHMWSHRATSSWCAWGIFPARARAEGRWIERSSFCRKRSRRAWRRAGRTESNCAAGGLAYDGGASAPSAGENMAINTSKVVVGGLVAGIVASVLGFLRFGLWLGPKFQAEAAAVAPSLAQAMTGTATAATVVTTFIIGW